MSDQTTHTEGINKKPVTSKTTVKTGDAVTDCRGSDRDVNSVTLRRRSARGSEKA